VAIFRRGTSSSGAEPIDTQPVTPPAGKGHATPKRRDAEAANKRPLVPTDRKAAARTDRAKRNEARALERDAMVTGDDRHLPARDKGPVRRYVRDYLDARLTYSEFFLPISLVLILLVLVRRQDVLLTVSALAAVYLLAIVAVFEAVIVTYGMKKKVIAKFGEFPKGTRMYGVNRMFQVRRLRMPRPQVKRGQHPS
jgi:hypothetical protein